ncbi:MAG: hypothetical protein GYA24_25040, partial [Candidatus Lokiarchaeota archaeon]|nr:hypothetical protein [Candidatus Lokiarchaeota archaeon]
ITSMVVSGSNGAGPYVGGMSFTLTITFSNTGGTQATGVGVALTFGGYTHLTPNAPATVAVNAGSTNTQAFMISIAAAATTATVTLSASWSGTEAISNRILNGGPNTQTVVVQARAIMSITSIQYTNGTGTYVGGMKFTVRVTFSNTGGTDASVDATLTFGSYAHLTQDDPSVIVVIAGGSQTQDFIVTVANGATSAAVTINATFSATEFISSRVFSGNAGSSVRFIAIQSRAAVTITNIQQASGTGTYVGGMVFLINVTFSNTGGTAATVDAILNFGGYVYLTQSDPEAVTLPASSTVIQVFTVSALAAATTATVTINATWTGSEAISSRVLAGHAGSNTRNVNIQARANVIITSVAYITGNGTYVAGMTFIVRVSFQNTGGTSATVDATLSFGTYGFLTPSDPPAITIPANGTQQQEFTVSIAQIATYQNPVVISTSWTGTEAISGRSLSGDQGVHFLNVKIQSAASLAITAVIDLNGTSPYGWGKNFTARVTIENAGGTTINSLTVMLGFGASTGIMTSPSSYTGQSIGAGASQNYQFIVLIGVGATLGTLTIIANVTGNEDISGDILSDVDNSLQVIVEAPPSITINTISTTTPLPYTRGSMLSVRVQLVNGGSALANGTVTLILPEGFTASPSASIMIYDIPYGSARVVNFNVTIGATAAYGPAMIDANFTGKTLGGVDVAAYSATTPLSLQVLTPSNILITAIEDVLGTAHYVQGMQFDVRVRMENNGQLDVLVSTLTLMFNGTGYSSIPVSPFVLGGSSTSTMLVRVQVGAGADTGRIVITAILAGTEAATGNGINVDTAPLNLTVIVGSQASVSISSIQYVTGTGIYVEPHSFLVRVTFINTGETNAISIAATLVFNGYSFLSTDTPASIVVPSFGSAFQIFNVTIVNGATAASVTINATWTGVEAISGRIMGGDAGSNTEMVSIQRAAQLSVDSLQDITGLPRYVQGMSFSIQVTVTNPGGTDILNADLWLVINASGYASTGSVVNVTAGATIFVVFSISIANNAQVGPVSINCVALGTEDITGDIVYDFDGASTPLVKVVQARSQLALTTIVDITSQPYYIQGQSLLVNVTIDNTAGGTAVTLGTLQLAFNKTGYSSPQQDGLTIGAGGVLSLQFTVTISVSAQPGLVLINATFSGKEQYSDDLISISTAIFPLTITCKSRASVAVSSIVDSSTTKVHKLGSSFTYQVTISNTGGATAVSGVLSISLGATVNVTAMPVSHTSITSNGFSNTQFTFLVTIAKPALTGNFTITFTYSGLEEITGRGLAHQNSTWMVVQDESNVVIERVESLSGSGPFKQGGSLFVRVRLNNLGVVGVQAGVLTLIFNSTGYITNPVSITGITIGGLQIVTQTFQVNVGMFAVYGKVLIDAEFHATESGTLDPVHVTNATTKLVIEVLPRPASLSLVGGSVSINWSFAGEHVVFRGQQNIIVYFSVYNGGGATAMIDFSGIDFSDPYDVDYSAAPHPGSNPVSIPAGATRVFGFKIGVSTVASLGINISLFANILTTDTFYGNQTTWHQLISWWIPRAAPSIVVETSTIAHADLVQGETGVILQLRLYNGGIFPASITAASLRFMNGMTNFASNFMVSSNWTFPALLNSNEAAWIQFMINVSGVATPDLNFTIQLSTIATASIFDISLVTGSTGLSCIVRTPAQLRVTSVIAVGGRVNATRGQENIDFQVTIQNLNGTRAIIVDIVLVFNNTILNGQFTVQHVGAVVGTIVNGYSTVQYTLRVTVSTTASLGLVEIDARVYATGLFVLNNASHASGASVTASLLVIAPGETSIPVITIIERTISPGGKLTVTISFDNTGGTAILLNQVEITASIRGIDVSSALVLQQPLITISGIKALSGRVIPGGRVEISITIIVSEEINDVARHDMAFALTIKIRVIDENTGSVITGTNSKTITIAKDIVPIIIDIFTDYGIFIFIGIGALVAMFVTVGARKAKIKKATKAKLQQSKGKEYFAKQMAISTGKPAPTDEKLAPFIGKEAPIGKSAKKAAEAAAKEETRPELTPEQLAEQQKTEAEVTTFKEKKICLVHKGPVSGNIYLCPQCDALYCVKCAGALKQAGEKCWQCGSPIVVSDFAVAEAQAAIISQGPPAGVQPAPGVAPVTIPATPLASGPATAIPTSVTAAGPAAELPAKPAGPSFVMRNMNRINTAMQALNLPHDAKMKYLKQMDAMAEADQVRFLMEIEKMAYPDKVVADEVAFTDPALDDKLSLVQTAAGEPSTTVTDADLLRFLGQGFTTLEHELIDQVNVLPWPKEKKLACLKEMLALTPQERFDLLQEMFRQDVDYE